MRKLFITFFSFTVLVLTSFLFSQDISPTLSIRYEDFINEPTPSVAIGLRLDIDADRYTGWEVTTDQANFDTRLLMGWKWGLIGVGAMTHADDVNKVYPHYTFGVSYELLDGLRSNFEYVMTQDYDKTDADLADLDSHLRLVLNISF